MRKIDDSAFIAEGTKVLRDVVLEKNSSVWFGAVLRGDENRIVIGEGSNIQDNCVVHVGANDPTIVGKNVTVGHLAILHGCTIGDNTLIGMHSTIMNGAVIGSGCIIGACSLVTEKTVIPDNSLAFGSPAKVIRRTTEEERARVANDAQFYIREAAHYKSE